MEEKVRLYVNKKEMHEYIVAAVFNCIVAIIIAGLVFIRFDSLVAFIFIPISVAIFVCSFETIIEGVMVEKKRRRYIGIEDGQLIYYSVFRHVKYRIHLDNIKAAEIIENELKVYVFRKRHLKFREKIISDLFEDKYYMYSLTLYSEEKEYLDFISYVPVLAEAKRSRVGKGYNINGLSRLLGTLIISIATWTFFSCKIKNLSMDALVLADVAIILGFDIYFNDATFFQKKI